MHMHEKHIILKFPASYYFNDKSANATEYILLHLPQEGGWLGKK